MPILIRSLQRGRSPVKSAVEKVIFDKLYIDTTTGNATAYFTKYVADVPQPDPIIFDVGPEVVGPLLYARGDASKTRSADIATAVYELALKEGWFIGTII